MLRQGPDLPPPQISSQAGAGASKDRAQARGSELLPLLEPGLGLGAGLVGWPWVGGKEENQLSGNYPAVGSGAHDTVFIESSLQLLIPRSRVNPFQAAGPAQGGGRTQNWGRPAGSGIRLCGQPSGGWGRQRSVTCPLSQKTHVGSWECGNGAGDGHGQTSAPWPESRIWFGVRGGVRAHALPSGRAQASAPDRRRGANPASGAHPGCLSGPAASSSPPRPSASRGRPRPPLGPGLAAAATQQRSGASPRPRVPRAGRGAVSACVARARAGRGGLCLRPSCAGPPDRVLCPPSLGTRAGPPPRVRGAAGFWAPRQRGPPQPNPAPTLPPKGLGHSGTYPPPGGPAGDRWVLVITWALGVQGHGGRSVTLC